MTNLAPKEYGWHSAQVPPSQEYLFGHLISLVESLRGQRVLDLGCGNGYLCGQLACRGFSVVGLDADFKGIEIAKKAYPNANFIRSPISNAVQYLSLRSFDIVVCSEVIEHLFDPAAVPEVARKVLKQDGTLVISTPYHGYLKNLCISLFDYWDEHHDSQSIGGHIKFWSRPTITGLLQQNGFRVARFAGVGRVPFLWKSIVVEAKLISA